MKTFLLLTVPDLLITAQPCLQKATRALIESTEHAGRTIETTRWELSKGEPVLVVELQPKETKS